MTSENPNARVERLLALLLIAGMKDASMTDKSIALTRVGFSSPEIAEMLGTTRLVSMVRNSYGAPAKVLSLFASFQSQATIVDGRRI